MSEQSGGAGGNPPEFRAHARQARERDPDERDPATGVAGDAETDPDNPAPPGNVQTGEVSGGS